MWSELLRTMVALALVSAAAFFALRWVARRGGLGMAALPGTDSRVELRVLARVALEPRKALYLVRVGERVLLLGTGEAGPPSLLLELPRDERPAATAVVASTAESSDG